MAFPNEEERKRSILMMYFNHFPGAHNENIFPGEWKRTLHQFRVQSYSKDRGSCLTLLINSKRLTCNIRPSCLIQPVFARSTQRNQNDSCTAKKSFREKIHVIFMPSHCQSLYPIPIRNVHLPMLFMLITLKVQGPKIIFFCIRNKVKFQHSCQPKCTAE